MFDRSGRDIEAQSVLLVTTCWWSTSARFLQLLRQAGCRISVLCPKGHPATGLKDVLVLKQNWRKPLECLSAAIARCTPSVIVPGDDRAVAILHQLYDTGSAAERSLIERSIGPKTAYPAMVSRVRLMELATKLDIPVPGGAKIAAEPDLEAWMNRTPGPWVLKSSGSWSGLGVRVAQTRQQALAAYRHLRSHPTPLRSLKHLLVNRNPYFMADWLAGGEPEVSAQAWVHGRRADLAMFCREGEMLAATMAETIASEGTNGATLIARVIERKDGLDAARTIARELNLNGFHGLDFIIEEATDRALLIEMNPRLTPLTNIRGAADRDVIGSAARFFVGKPFPAAEIVQPGRAVAYFPGAWKSHRNDPSFATAFQDVPWDEPKLMAEMLKPAWPDRQPLARFSSRCRGLLQRIASRRQRLELKSFAAVDGFARPNGTAL